MKYNAAQMIQLAEFEPLVGVQERVVKTLYLLIKCPFALMYTKSVSRQFGRYAKDGLQMLSFIMLMLILVFETR